MAWGIESATGGVIVLTFKGRLTGDEGRRSAIAFASLAGQRSIHVVWDVSAMTGYDSDARAAWQRVVLPLQKQLLSITLIGGTGLMKMGASAIALVVGLPCRFVASRKELEAGVGL